MSVFHQPYSEAVKIPLPLAAGIINAYGWFQRQIHSGMSPQGSKEPNRTFIIDPEVML